MTVRSRSRSRSRSRGGAAILFLLAGTGFATGLMMLLVVGIDRFIAGLFTGAGS